MILISVNSTFKKLSFIISIEDIQIDPQKVNTILDWTQPTSFRQVRLFLKFCNFYQYFIWVFSKLAKPFISLTKKNIIFDLSPACQSAFDSLKKVIIKKPILTHYNQSFKRSVKINLSDYISSGVFFQLGNNRLLHLITFFSKNLNFIEYNYEIYDRKLLAIIRYYEQWRLELEGIGVLVKVIIEHKSLKCFITIKKLTKHQAYWAEFLSEFKFVIFYTTGKENYKADI